MALLGGRNWWAPAPLRRLHDRVGLSEGGPVGFDHDDDANHDPDPEPLVGARR